MEYIQSFGRPYPKYEVLGEIGPDHQKIFLVGVYVENKLVGTGIGGTKKEAEQIAAKKVLDLSDYLL
jgi:ribonuclease-3